MEQNWNILTLHQRQRFVFNQVQEWFLFVRKKTFQQLDSLETNPTYPVTRYKLIWLPKPYLERHFLAGGWRHLSLSPQPGSCLLGRVQSATGFTPSSPKELLVRISCCPSPNEGPETISRWDPPQAWSPMAHPGWTWGASGGCICLEEKKSSKGTRQLAHFPSHTKERTGGSPWSLRHLRSLLFITRGPGAWAERTLESKPALERWLRVDFVFSFYFLKENQSPEKDKFWPVVICFGSD